MTNAIATHHNQRLSNVSMNLKINGTLKLGRVSCEGLSNLSIEIWVARLPDAIAEMNAFEIQRTASKCENCVLSVVLDRVNSSAFF